MSSYGKSQRPHMSKDDELRVGFIIRSEGLASELRAGAQGCIADILDDVVHRGEVAKEELCRANIGLVTKQACTFTAHVKPDLDDDDIVQWGMMGLVVAVNHYDPTRGNKFSTMAMSWIYQAMSRGNTNMSRTVRLPEAKVMMFGQITQAMRRDVNGHTGALSQGVEERVARRLGLGMDEYHTIVNAGQSALSINYPSPREGVTDTSGESYLHTSRYHTLSQATIESVRPVDEQWQAPEDVVDRYVERLSLLDQHILYAKFKVGRPGPATIREVCRLHHISYKACRQETVRLLSSLRRDLSELNVDRCLSVSAC